MKVPWDRVALNHAEFALDLATSAYFIYLFVRLLAEHTISPNDFLALAVTSYVVAKPWVASQYRIWKRNNRLLLAGKGHRVENVFDDEDDR